MNARDTRSLQAFHMRPRGLEPPRAKRSQGPQPYSQGVRCVRRPQTQQLGMRNRTHRTGLEGRLFSGCSHGAPSRTGRANGDTLSRRAHRPSGRGVAGALEIPRDERMGGAPLARINAYLLTGLGAVMGAGPPPDLARAAPAIALANGAVVKQRSTGLARRRWRARGCGPRAARRSEDDDRRDELATWRR